jgi:hypothetical protein
MTNGAVRLWLKVEGLLRWSRRLIGLDQASRLRDATEKPIRQSHHRGAANAGLVVGLQPWQVLRSGSARNAVPD